MNQINVSSTLNLPSVVCRMYFIKNRKEVALKDWEKQYVGRHVEDDEYLVCWGRIKLKREFEGQVTFKQILL